MKKLLLLSLTLFSFLFMNMLQAQINIGGNPVSINYEKILEPLTFEVMPPLDFKTIEEEDAQWDAEVAAGGSKIGRRFGISFEVDYDLHNSGTWSNLPDGGKLWRLGIECPGALSINLIFDRYRLPKGATLYVFAENGSDKIGGFTDYNNQADNFFATDIVKGDKIVIEYYQPANAAFEGELRLATIVHGYRGLALHAKLFGEAGACQRNTICPEGTDWQDQVKAVFALYDGNKEVCSGTILNNTANDRKPYALTANHCWNSHQNTGTWVFRFRWESPTCTPSTNSSYHTMTGAVLRMRSPTNTSSTDACLVELNQMIPEEWEVYYAGWSRSTVPSPSAMCISHPSLDIKKISPTLPLYTVTQYVLGWRTDWSTAACTEGGSSGSGLFDSNKRIVGQLWGGESKCSTYGTSLHYDVYGRFDLSWNGLPGGVSDLKTWLDPLNLDPQTWDGFYGEMVDAELTEIMVPEASYTTAATINPKVKIKNTGDFPITTATVTYTIDGGYPVTKTWEGNLDLGATVDITFDAITLTYGTHVFEATVAVPEDGNVANNSKTKNYTVTITNAPYVNYESHEIVGGEKLTYISKNKEIAVTLKNVGVLPANGPLAVTFSCDDPQLTVTQTTAQCETLAPNGTATVTCKVTVANDIPDAKSFHVKISVSNGENTWGSVMPIVAYAPAFKLEKVLVNGTENGNLPKDAMVFLSATVKNVGGADAYKVKGNLEFTSPYLTLACDENAPVVQLLPAGESSNLCFYVITNQEMPSGYEVAFNLALSALYERTYSTTFKVANSGSNNYCVPENSNCSLSSPDKFTSVKLYKTTTPTVMLIDHNPPCGTNGYSNFTSSIVVPLEPGQYKLDVSVGTGGIQHIKGWFDLNGNNEFENNDIELLVTGSCASGGSTSFTFTIPQNFVPGESRFRLRCKYSSTMNNACEGYNFGQTLDYTIVLPELYPRVQNVEAELQGNSINITWLAPATGTPIGYNIYRNGNKLNDELLTDLSFTETELEQGVYAYNVKAFYTGNKESYAEMSNVICYFWNCDPPTDLDVTKEGKTAILKWDAPKDLAGEFLGYLIYRNGTIIYEDIVITETEFKDENLPVGTYTYQVSAVSSICEETEKTDSVSITIVYEYCEPPVDLDGYQLIPLKGFFGVYLTWEKPKNIDGVLLGYHVHRDEEPINEELVNETIYIDDKEFLPPGTYSYQVSAVYEHCESVLTDAILIDVENVGVKDIHNDAFSIYPNPTNGDFVIQSSKFKVQSVEIYDVYGRKVFDKFPSNSLEGWTAKPDGVVIDLTVLHAGVYFVKIYAEENQIAIKKLIINH